MSAATFETKDLLLAAYLRAFGHTMLEARPDGRQLVIFTFLDTPRLQQTCKEFLENGTIRVRTLAREMSNLRNLCREIKRSRGSTKEPTPHDRPDEPR